MVRQRSVLRTGGYDPADQGNGLVVKGDDPLRMEFAKATLEPRSIAENLVDVVKFEVEELADTKPARPIK